FIPSASLAEALAAEIGPVAGKRIIFPCGDLARDTLPAGLRARGAEVDAVIAYRTVPDPAIAGLLPLLRAAPPDAITFTSASTVRFLFAGLGASLQPDAIRALLAPVAVACIGPVTAAAAREHGLRVAVEAGDHTSAGLLAALAAYFRGVP
ncbi:MAG TPA: uroporphyrinogen-III synthase, partial [Herpetosiphonaceae bacterium]